MTDTTKELAEALESLRKRADEHATSDHGEYREYAAGINDSLTALEPLIAALSAAAPATEGEREALYRAAINCPHASQ